MIGGVLIVTLISGQANWTLIAPTLVMSLGFPVANMISLFSQKKKHKTALEKREKVYLGQLAEQRNRLDGLVQKQRALLEDSYPALPAVLKIALSGSKSMWSRRPVDEDFLDLRIGTSADAPTIKIEPPRFSDPNDNLPALALELANSYQVIPDLPALLHLARLGSVAISGRTPAVYGLTRRLVLDLITHHSPEDVQVAVLGDTREAVEQWEWLKWIPHTDALGADRKSQRLAFEPLQIDKSLEMLMAEYQDRRGASDDRSSTRKKKGNQPAIVVLVDDSGRVRQHGDVHLLAEWGHEARIYTLFVGGRDWPRECRARIDLLDETAFRLNETWTRSGELREGRYEAATQADCEAVGRKLAGWEAAGAESRIPLPASIRLSQVLGTETYFIESIKRAWSVEFEPKDLLQFPVGVCARREQLDQAMINLLPADHGGYGNYHTILIGFTGSGKSEFMKSLVIGAAVRYPPSMLNFFFMDFKGGAAFSAFEDLPHVSGVVTNLKPELVERGLDSIKNEIDRRQADFLNAHVQNIWDYNRLHTDQPLPHLLLFLDEFARGLVDFPRLRETLDLLVRQGRSLGMYLILANQDANSEVDKLLNNVGWRIALKVGRTEEMSIIDRSLPNAERAGQGYLRSSNGEVTEFQAGYAGFAVQTDQSREAEGFTIFEVDADGSYKPVFKKTSASALDAKQAKGPVQKEEEKYISVLRQAAADLRIKPAARIYLEPLPETIPLESVFTEAGIQPCFENGQWKPNPEVRRISAYIGEQDLPQECLQETLKIDFSEKDGHLWIVGAQGSGKDMVLATLLLSLAHTYTPEQVHFYMLELGAGELAQFEDLPHTGAVIRPQKDDLEENERLVRLLDFLDQQMDQRTKSGLKAPEGQEKIPPALFVVINSYAELFSNFQDESERMKRFIRDGGSAGIHFIITTSRGLELNRSISSIISRRLVLQLGNKDEYMDILGSQVLPLVESIPGRAYWQDGEPVICQVAQPPAQLRQVVQDMQDGWKGARPRPVEILPECIPLAELLEQAGAPAPGSIPFPVGRAYETLELITQNLAASSPPWLVMGPKESGKSNFLACAALAVLQADPKGWSVRVYTLRRSLHLQWEELDKRIQVFSTAEEIIKDAQTLAAALHKGKPAASGKRLLLIIDELGFAFQPGKESLALALNELGQNLESAQDIQLMSSGLLEELRMQMTSPLVKYLRQNRTGMVLSKDTNEADWLGGTIQMEYRRMSLPVGRGFFISKGKTVLVQTPFQGDCYD